MPILEWQPVVGCSKISTGCANCKSPGLAASALPEEFAREGLTRGAAQGLAVWTGAVRFSAERLDEPQRLAEPAHVYVCPHGDLFHDSVPDAWIDRVFAEIEASRRHTFYVLTKRAARMADYCTARYRAAAPPDRLWIGVSAERQQEADERIPHLLRTPVAHRYLTLYPVLGPIDLMPYLETGGIRFVTAGEEPERPADRVWMLAIAEQCEVARIPFQSGGPLVGETRTVTPIARVRWHGAGALDDSSAEALLQSAFGMLPHLPAVGSIRGIAEEVRDLVLAGDVHALAEKWAGAGDPTANGCELVRNAGTCMAPVLADGDVIELNAESPVGPGDLAAIVYRLGAFPKIALYLGRLNRPATCAPFAMPYRGRMPRFLYLFFQRDPVELAAVADFDFVGMQRVAKVHPAHGGPGREISEWCFDVANHPDLAHVMPVLRTDAVLPLAGRVVDAATAERTALGARHAELARAVA